MKQLSSNVQELSQQELSQINGGGLIDPYALRLNIGQCIRNFARAVGFIRGVNEGFSEGYSKHSYKM